MFTDADYVREIDPGFTSNTITDPQIVTYIEKSDAWLISRLAIPSGFALSNLTTWQAAATPPEILSQASAYRAAMLILLATLQEGDDDGQALRRSFRKIADDIVAELLAQKRVVIDSAGTSYMATGVTFTSDDYDEDERLFPRTGDSKFVM